MDHRSQTTNDLVFSTFIIAMKSAAQHWISSGGQDEREASYLLGASALLSSVSALTVAQELQVQYVQIAEIEIDSAQLEDYKAAVKEQIETAIRQEFWSY